MDDLISRQEVLDSINYVMADYIPFLYGEFDKIPLDIKRAILKVPSVKPEQKTGKWEFLCHQNLKCSECGYVICEDDADEYKYCPNCGAKMEEGE